MIAGSANCLLVKVIHAEVHPMFRTLLLHHLMMSSVNRVVEVARDEKRSVLIIRWMLQNAPALPRQMMTDAEFDNNDDASPTMPLSCTKQHADAEAECQCITRPDGRRLRQG